MISAPVYSVIFTLPNLQIDPTMNMMALNLVTGTLLVLVIRELVRYIRAQLESSDR